MKSRTSKLFTFTSGRHVIHVRTFGRVEVNEGYVVCDAGSVVEILGRNHLVEGVEAFPVTRGPVLVASTRLLTERLYRPALGPVG